MALRSRSHPPAFTMRSFPWFLTWTVGKAARLRALSVHRAGRVGMLLCSQSSRALSWHDYKGRKLEFHLCYVSLEGGRTGSNQER